MMNLKMRDAVLSLAMMAALSAMAQHPATATPAGSNWQHVQVLPEGTSIRVKATNRSAACKLKSVDADSLTCASGTDKEIVFQRGEVKSIKIHHRGRSAAVGGAIGIGAGLGTGYGVGKAEGAGDWSGTIAAGTGIGFGLLGALIGVATEFTHSTVYKGP
jgi:hypothetical protein